MAQAFVADRVVTPQGTRRAALLLEEGPAGMIRAVCEAGELPVNADVIDFGHQADVDNIGLITPRVEAGQ